MFRSPSESNSGLAIIITLLAVLFGVYHIGVAVSQSISPDLNFIDWSLLFLKLAVEIGALFYGVAFVCIGMTYLFLKSGSERENFLIHKEENWSDLPTVGVIYLCCNDIDREALIGIAQLNYKGKIKVIVHDDSIDPKSQAEVDGIVNNLRRRRPDIDISLLRRTAKGGGKAAVMNYILNVTGDEYEYFVMCDNDSMFLQPDTIQKALKYLSNDNIAIAQFRIKGINSREYCRVNRYLKNCIDAFHVFMSVFSKYGWSPFIGHNAMLRTKPILDRGGFKPGFFSDDLDMTVRLNLAGLKVTYAPDVVMGEKHPPSYASFRKRAYKWAYGCMQSAKAHFPTVMTCNKFTFSEKFTFLFFIGFYFMQGILLSYLVLTFLVIPWTNIFYPYDLSASLIVGTTIILTIFFPFICYFIKEKSILKNLGSILFGGLIYGSTDFQSIRGIWDCLTHKKREWVPTNQTAKLHSQNIFAEVIFGAILFIIPLFKFPSILFLPCSYLFAGKFLFVPAFYTLYDDLRERIKSKTNWAITIAGAVIIYTVSIMMMSGMSHPSSLDSEKIEIKGKDIYLNGNKFIIQGIQYSPWRSGTGPNKSYPYPAPNLIQQDLTLIGKMHVNTILIYDAPASVIDLARKNNLFVIYTFSIYWNALGTSDFKKEKEKILNKVKLLKDQPNILAWQLGNEIPIESTQKVNQDTIENEMRDLYSSVKAIDSHHLITHGNWPPTKSLKFDFFDFESFNVYPVWPPEVVAHGYGNYISEFLQPIAGKKPLLISEFGVNSLEGGEADQARIVEQCWKELNNAGACGGVVFSFADEWWKNYNNPIKPDQWWYRVDAPNDELKHDLDPEEYYGVVHADRTPKPAYFTVQKMFEETSDTKGKEIPAIVAGTLFLVALGVWLWSRRKSKAA